MKLIEQIQTTIDTFKLKSSDFEYLKRHKTLNAKFYGSVYTDYLKKCRRVFDETVDCETKISKAASEFQKNGFTSFWTEESNKIARSIFEQILQEEREKKNIWDENGRYYDEIYQKFPEIESLFQGCLGCFLKSVYQANFKIFYGLIYKSERILDHPTGSQIWHSDGGPGTCINVMLYLKDVEKEDGALECLPWKYSLKIYKKNIFKEIVSQRIKAMRSIYILQILKLR